jgi:hypothetical protein
MARRSCSFLLQCERAGEEERELELRGDCLGGRPVQKQPAQVLPGVVLLFMLRKADEVRSGIAARNLSAVTKEG